MDLHIDTKSEVQKFYSGKTIFLTGATGFLGKLIAEKLLRSCRNLKRIHMLVRPKKGKNINERYEELFAGPSVERYPWSPFLLTTAPNGALLFRAIANCTTDPAKKAVVIIGFYVDIKHMSMERLKREHPEFREKISIVNGDMLLPNLGMSKESIEILKRETEIVIHCAATTRFNQKIREATYINVRSLRDLVDIAKDMKKLQSFLYISTAYSHCPRNYIGEILYDPPLKPEDLMRLVDMLDSEKLDQITPSILGEWPNTYSFTKAIAEGIMNQEATNLPIVVVRPSIVIACAKEPEPGWIDSIYGPTGYLLVGILGIVSAYQVDPDAIADLVPADYVVNCILVAAYRRTKIGEITNTQGVPRNQNQVCPVYNFCCSPKQPPVTWKILTDSTMEMGPDILPSTHILWYPGATVVRNKYLFAIKELQTTLLASIVDMYFALKGKEQIAMKGINKIRSLSKALKYFTIRNWKFEISNTKDLFESLNSVDQDIFEFDMEKFVWKKYVPAYLKGIRLYLMKDPLENLSAGRRHVEKLRIYHYICCSIIYLTLLYLIVRIVNLFI